MRGTWYKKLKVLLRNGLKEPRRQKVDILVFAIHPAVNSGVLAGGGSMAVAVGVSDM